MALHPRDLLAGAGLAVAARVLLRRALLVKFERDVRALNAGASEPLLASYADDAVLRFHAGEHRWSGPHRGRAEIAGFLREFTRAGLQGQIRELFVAGPPWRLTLIARFDDRATLPGGEQLYANRTVLVVRTRRGRIVDQDVFYEDTERLAAFDVRLRELGIEPSHLASSAARGVE